MKKTTISFQLVNCSQFSSRALDDEVKNPSITIRFSLDFYRLVEI